MPDVTMEQDEQSSISAISVFRSFQWHYHLLSNMIPSLPKIKSNSSRFHVGKISSNYR